MSSIVSSKAQRKACRIITCCANWIIFTEIPQYKLQNDIGGQVTYFRIVTVRIRFNQVPIIIIRINNGFSRAVRNMLCGIDLASGFCNHSSVCIIGNIIAYKGIEAGSAQPDAIREDLVALPNIFVQPVIIAGLARIIRSVTNLPVVFIVGSVIKLGNPGA